jgi:hypothetical protein
MPSSVIRFTQACSFSFRSTALLLCSWLFHEFVNSHRAHGWLILESASVSYRKASAYMPLIELLESYLKIEDRDDVRAVRSKVTATILTLQRMQPPPTARSQARTMPSEINARPSSQIPAGSGPVVMVSGAIMKPRATTPPSGWPSSKISAPNASTKPPPNELVGRSPLVMGPLPP